MTVYTPWHATTCQTFYDKASVQSGYGTIDGVKSFLVCFSCLCIAAHDFTELVGK